MRFLSPNVSLALVVAFLAAGPAILSSPTLAQGAIDPTAQIEFVFTGFKVQSGHILAELSCVDRPGASARIYPAQAAVRGSEVVIQFLDLREGQICWMRAFRDENGNQQLDLGPLGIPKEPFAFSNNAQAGLGPPKSEMTRFVLRSGANRQTIRIK